MHDSVVDPSPFFAIFAVASDYVWWVMSIIRIIFVHIPWTQWWVVFAFGSPPFTNDSNIMSSAMQANKHDAFIKIWVADQQEYLEKWRAVGSGLEFYSWTMFLNYRKSETDVYMDGTPPPLFHDFAIKLNYKKRKCQWSY